MLKNNKSMVVASMLCASVMVGLYSAPVFAAPVNGDELKIEGSDGNFVIKEVVPGKTMIYTEAKNGDDTLYLDPASGNLSTKGTISVGGLDGNSIKTVIDGTSGSIAVGLKNGVPQINLDADTGEVNAKTFNGVSLATNGDEVLVNGIDVKAMGNNVAGIRRATKGDRASTYIEDTVRVNNKAGLWVYEEDGTTVAASINREGAAEFNSVNVAGNVVADGLGRFGSLNGPNVRMEKGELTINSSATNKVVSMSAEGLKMYGDDGKLNVLLTREGGLALNQNLSVRGNVSIDGTINGATITAESFNGVNIGELANSVEGIDKVSANVAGITRPSENETIIEGKVAINSVGNVYTPGSIIAENGFSTGNGNFAVSGATGDITTKGAINGVSLSENGIKFGKDGKTQILASVAGDAIINGNTIGFDGINASGGLSVGVLDKKFGVDADGNVEAQGTLSVANGAFKVDKDGTVTSKVGNSTLYVGADQAGMKNGNNAVVVDNNGVLLGNAFGSNVRVGENGVTFNNGEAGFTTINGGNISNGKFSVDKDGNIQATTYNGINIEDLKSDFETSNKNVAGIERRESAVEDEYVTVIEGKTMIASDGTFSTATGKFVVGADGSIASQFADDGALVANKDGFAVAKGANSVNVNEHGVGLAAGADNQVSVTNNGIGMQAGTSQVIMNSANGAVFRNGDKDANGETVINGGNITATGTINGATITDKAFNGVEIGNGLVDGVDVSELKGSFDEANENVAGITRKDGTTTIEDVFSVNKESGAIFNGAVNLGSNASFTSGKYGSINLGDFYDEYRTNVGKFDEAIKDLQDKTQNITADKNGTHFEGDVTVNGNVGVGGDASTNGGNISADSGVIGGVGMENGNISAGTGTIGGVGMENGNISANSGTIGGVGMENGNIAANSGTIGGVGMENGNIAANSGTIGGVGMENGNIAANSGTIGDVAIAGDKVTTGDTTVSKDGVTVGGENGTSVSKDDVVINKGTDKEVSLSNVGSRVDNLEQGLADANSRIDRVDEKIDKVGAMAAAIANLRTMGYDPEAPTEIAVGVGQYRSETGAALGFFHYPNKDFMLSMSVSTSGDEVMGGIGATWKFGRKTPAEMNAAKERAAEKAKLEKADAIKKAAELAKVEKQQQRHAELAAKKAAK